MKIKSLLKANAPYLSCALLSLTLIGCGSSDKKDEPQVETAQGTYQGVQSDGLISFKGMRYAAAPSGQLRFQPPVAPQSFASVKLADTFGSACPQEGGILGPSSEIEDCLFLNVYTPDTEGEYPVMVWIHGGAFITGSGGDSYNPTRLVKEGITVVTLNYRLGALGFLAHPALSEAAGEGVGSGNYGLMDQQFALQWVQDNIEAFGGNPDNVTIFGESAGGHSVMDQLSISTSEGLFHKAIVQSGTYHLEEVSLAAAEAYVGTPLVNKTECAESEAIAACLKALPVKDMLAAQGSDQFLPTTGTAFHPISPLIAANTGTLADVPLINGNNKNEGTLFTALAQFNLYEETLENATPEVAIATASQLISSQETYEAEVTKLLTPFPFVLNGHSIEDIAAEYLNGTTEYYDAYNRLQTDWRFACTAIQTANTLKATENRSSAIFEYHFTDQNAPNLFGPYFPIGFDSAASHASEIPYVLSDGSDFTEDADQAALSEAMIDYWTTFAKNGDPNPNNSNLTLWPAFDAQGDNMIELNTTISTLAEADFNTTHNCDYWNTAP